MPPTARPQWEKVPIFSHAGQTPSPYPPGPDKGSPRYRPGESLVGAALFKPTSHILRLSQFSIYLYWYGKTKAHLGGTPPSPPQ